MSILLYSYSNRGPVLQIVLSVHAKSLEQERTVVETLNLLRKFPDALTTDTASGTLTYANRRNIGQLTKSRHYGVASDSVGISSVSQY